MAYLKGARGIINNLKKVTKQMSGAYKSGTTEVTLKVRAESNRLVPVDTGHLRDSVGSGALKSNNNGALGFVGYGSKYPVEYAVRIHEELGWVHAATKQAKFLERAMLDSQQYLLESYKKYINKVL